MAAVAETTRLDEGPPTAQGRKPKVNSDDPADFMANPGHDVVTNIEDIYTRMDSVVSSLDWEVYEGMVYDILAAAPMTEKALVKGASAAAFSDARLRQTSGQTTARRTCAKVIVPLRFVWQ
jgi:hypothetical protein